MLIAVSSFGKSRNPSAIMSVKNHVVVRSAVAYAQNLKMNCDEPSLLNRHNDNYKFLISCQEKENELTGGSTLFIEVELEHSDDMSILKNIHFEYAG